MSSERKREFYPWFAWKIEKIEKYLEDMAAQGWHVEKIGFSQLFFRFRKGEPQKVRYCADYQWRATEEYKQILADDGWEMLDDFAGWMLWRKPYLEKRPQLYTDRASLVERNNRIIFLVSVCLLAQIPAISTNSFERVIKNYLGRWPLAGNVFMVVYAFLVLFMAYGLVRLFFLNKRLTN